MVCLTLMCKQSTHFAAALQEVMEFAVPLTTNEVHKERSPAPGLPVIPMIGGTSFLQTRSHPSLHLRLVCQTT